MYRSCNLDPLRAIMLDPIWPICKNTPREYKNYKPTLPQAYGASTFSSLKNCLTNIGALVRAGMKTE